MYCGPVPPTAIYDPVKKRMACQAGWQETMDSEGQLRKCSLCGAGHFAAVAPTSSSAVVCAPCPQGTYTAASDTVGNCTACAYPQTTAGSGSVGPDSCGCPPPTVARPDGSCTGCLTNQFADGGACHNCPPNSLALPSSSQCVCAPGYEAKPLGCTPCRVGFYSSHATNNHCTQCPAGSSTVGSGSSSLTDCVVCAPGYYLRTIAMGCWPLPTLAEVAVR